MLMGMTPRETGPGKRTGSGVSRKPGIVDVARIAGVSNMTVSRVINDLPGVGDDTRLRVRAVMAELGFEPNWLGRALKTGRSKSIGVVCIGTPLFGPTATLFGVEQAARSGGYSTNVISLASITSSSLRAALIRLKAQQVAAIIVISPMSSSAEALRELPADIPTVAIWAPADVGVSVAGMDHQAAAATATRHLLEIGHATVWHISGPSGWTGAEQRMLGWRHALEEEGRDIPEPIVGDWTAQSGYSAGLRLLQDPRVTAVFAASDQMALGLLRAAYERGLRVPEDLSVVGYDDGPDSAFFSPPLTTMRQDFARLGSRAFDLAMSAVNGLPAPEYADTDAPQLVIRQSTAPPRLVPRQG
jgi:DNA-binding LacI/PurR family transcriptional regulator